MDKKTAQLMVIILIISCIIAFVVVSQQPPPDGWMSEGNQASYILNGRPVTGWQNIEGNRYYFDESGHMQAGWQEIDQARYYFSPDGRLRTGWLDRNGNRYYLHEDGKLAVGWLELGGRQYFFDDNGMTTGIMLQDGAAYLFNDQGHLSNGWVELDGQRYYGDAAGHPFFGWNEINGKQHYFHENGAAASGWVNLNGFTHYFYIDGAPAQGKVTIDEKDHYFASNGQQLMLVNPWHFVPEDYTVKLVSINDTHKVAEIAYQDFLDMMADCRAEGHVPMVCSSYRTHEYQEELYQNRIKRYVNAGYSEEKATELAGYSVAVPGTSEHQLGLALDIVDDDNWHLDETQADMPTQKWLMANSWRYGWILRYPSEKSEYTGIIYEPWHYRYVGKTVAKEIYESGLCLEEYLQMLTNSVG